MSTNETPNSLKSQRRNIGLEYFKNVASKVGIELYNSFNKVTQPIVIIQEQSLVVRDIEKCLRLNDSLDDNIRQFLHGFTQFRQCENAMPMLLKPTALRKLDNADNAIDVPQESVIRMLLKVADLQANVIDMLLDEISEDECAGDSSRLRLILSQLYHLPYIHETAQLGVKLADLVEVSSLAFQYEILESLPQILPECEYEKIVDQLIDKFIQDDENAVAAAILNCLNEFNLKEECRMRMQETILSKVVSGTCTKILPILLDFLFSDCKASDLPNICAKLRTALDPVLSGDAESEKVVIFKKLQICCYRKTVADCWTNAVTVFTSAVDYKPFDLLMLFIIHEAAKPKRQLIESLIRRRAKDGLFKTALLDKLFDRYFTAHSLKTLFPSIIECASNMLNTHNDCQGILQFGDHIIIQLFQHKYLEPLQRLKLVEHMLLLVGLSDTKHIRYPLNLLVSLSKHCADHLRNYAPTLMRLLDKLDTLELLDVKLVFEVLCNIICTEMDETGLKDELHIVVRKQLSSMSKHYKKNGIVAAVIMAKYMARDHGLSESFNPNESIVAIEQIRHNDCREAAMLIQLIQTCTSNTSTDLSGLFFDELAYMLSSEVVIDVYFMSWLYENMTNEFQTTYVTEMSTDKTSYDISGIEFTAQFNLNSNDEIDTPIVINFSKDSAVIKILAAHFRLVRLLHYRQQQGDLSSIDALLGCAVLLPKHLNNIDNYDSRELAQISDCLFHCCNWFRETISAFVRQKNRKLRMRVVQRIMHLIYLEDTLLACLRTIPDHKLPHGYFNTTTSITSYVVNADKQPPKKKMKTNNVNVTSASSQRASSATMKSRSEPICLRHIDTDLIILLKYPLTLDEACTINEDNIMLNVQQLEFILKDFVCKLQRITVDGPTTEDSHFQNILPVNIVTDCILILPNINKHLKVITETIDKLLATDTQDTDNKLDAPPQRLYTEHSMILRSCFGLILESLALLFSWSGFQQGKKTDILRDILKSLRGQDKEQCFNSASHLVSDTVKRFQSYTRQCLEISQAVNLVKIMCSLDLIIPNTENTLQVIHDTSAELLKRSWYGRTGNVLDTGKIYNASIDKIIQAFLKGSNTKTIMSFIDDLSAEVVVTPIKKKGDHLQILASIDRHTLPYLFRNLCIAFHIALKNELNQNQHLALWNRAAIVMQTLMGIAKAQCNRTILSTYLSKSLNILKIFLAHGVPTLERMMRSKPDQVVDIFKTIQSSTRFLHHLCCHSKVTKDQSIMTYVPQFRLTLETLVIKVKAALVANGCSAAFWMGNLKNRNLQGEDILSQTTTTDSESDDQSSIGDITEDDDDALDVLIEDDDENVLLDLDENTSNKTSEDQESVDTNTDASEAF